MYVGHLHALAGADQLQLRTMQDTIKSQRSDVFPKEKYVSSNLAKRQYDKEFVKLNEGNVISTALLNRDTLANAPLRRRSQQ